MNDLDGIKVTQQSYAEKQGKALLHTEAVCALT